MANSDTFEIRLSPTAFAKAMVARVARERRRIAVSIEQRADVQLGAGDVVTAELLREIAEDVRQGAGEGVTLRPMASTTEGAVFDEVDGLAPDADPLPPMRHGDDFEDGLSLVRAGHAFGRSMLPRD